MKIKLKLDADDLYNFSMAYANTLQTKIFNVLAIIVGFMMIYRGTVGKQGVFYIVIGIAFILMFTVINPYLLKTRAKKQAATNPMYQDYVTYNFTEEGILVEVQEQEGKIAWDQIIKIMFARDMYILYTGDRSAFILPEKKLGEDAADVMQYIYDHIPASVELPEGAKRS